MDGGSNPPSSTKYRSNSDQRSPRNPRSVRLCGFFVVLCCPMGVRCHPALLGISFCMPSGAYAYASYHPSLVPNRDQSSQAQGERERERIHPLRRGWLGASSSSPKSSITSVKLGYSRQQFYEIRRNYQTYGAEGLLDKLPGCKGAHPNRVAPEIEQTILDYSLTRPTHGPLRVA